MSLWIIESSDWILNLWYVSAYFISVTDIPNYNIYGAQLNKQATNIKTIEKKMSPKESLVSIIYLCTKFHQNWFCLRCDRITKKQFFLIVLVLRISQAFEFIEPVPHLFTCSKVPQKRPDYLVLKTNLLYILSTTCLNNGYYY